MQASLFPVEEAYAHLKPFPKAIQEAVVRAHTLPQFSVLSKKIRLVFAYFANCCNQKDGTAPFWGRVPNMAASAGVSEKTVQRAIKKMLELKWITMVGDRRDDNGKFDKYTLAFVPEVACLLGLPAGLKRRERTKLSAGLEIDLSYKKDQPGSPGASLQEEGQKPKIELPPELAAAAEEFGIADTGIAKLRGDAYKAGYQLADVVACCRARLQALGAKGGRAFRYMQTMIARPDADYAGRAAQEARGAAEAAEAAQRREAEEKLVGRAFRASTGVVYRFTSPCVAEVIENDVVTSIAAGREQTVQLMTAIARGDLVELHGTITTKLAGQADHVNAEAARAALQQMVASAAEHDRHVGPVAPPVAPAAPLAAAPAAPKAARSAMHAALAMMKKCVGLPARSTARFAFLNNETPADDDTTA